jgi:hypothetical protein
LSLSLVAYAAWHFAKAAFFRPESPFEWTTAERELLAAMPLDSRDLVAYQLASVTATTGLKAVLFTVLLLPDLRCVPLGLAGLLLAMLMLELLRIAIDIATWGMGKAEFLVYRAAVVAGLVSAGFAAAAVIVQPAVVAGERISEEGVRRRILDALVHVDSSAFGYVALPFRPVVDLILADRVTPTNLALAAAALAAVLVLAVAVTGLYSATVRRRVQREKRKYVGCATPLARQRITGASVVAPQSVQTCQLVLRLRRVPRWGGAGAVAWRQLVGASRHGGSLLTAMIAPAVLACIPVFVVADPTIALVATTGALAFYTFLLLPTALRFDFRRDFDRLATLKGLPVSPMAAVIGQLIAPILIASLFQVCMLAFAIIARDLPLHWLITVTLVMIPLNALVFGLDNLIYLLYPYRVQQEGLEIFLRTMLTFTAKGLLFACGMAAVSTWGFAATALTRAIEGPTGVSINTFAVFAAGMVLGPGIAASIVLGALARTYRNVNPIEDVPR